VFSAIAALVKRIRFARLRGRSPLIVFSSGMKHSTAAVRKSSLRRAASSFGNLNAGPHAHAIDSVAS
jgi:hypothetical protein